MVAQNNLPYLHIVLESDASYHHTCAWLAAEEAGEPCPIMPCVHPIMEQQDENWELEWIKSLLESAEDDTPQSPRHKDSRTLGANQRLGTPNTSHQIGLKRCQPSWTADEAQGALPPKRPYWHPATGDLVDDWDPAWDKPTRDVPSALEMMPWREGSCWECKVDGHWARDSIICSALWGPTKETQEAIEEKMNTIAGRRQWSRKGPYWIRTSTDNESIRVLSSWELEESKDETLGMISRLASLFPTYNTAPENTNKWDSEPHEISIALEMESNSCFLRGSIFGKEARFLIDTGASMSIITKSALAAIPGNHKLSLTRTTCRTADGTEVKIYGLCMLELEIAGVNFPLTLYVTSDGITNTGILGLDHMVSFGAKMDFSSEPFHLTLSCKKQSMVRRLEKCSETPPHTLSLMSETLLESSVNSMDQMITVIIPASVQAGDYRIRLTKQIQETHPHICLKDTATTVGSTNVCMKLPIWNDGDQVHIPAMTSIACIYAVKSIRVIHGKRSASEYQCLNDFKLPRPPRLTPAERSMIISDQIMTTHADKMQLTKEETDHLLGICNKFPNLWSIHPYEIREANNIPEKMIRKQGSKIANARPYCLSQYETVHMGYHISLLLESGVIERSTSAYNSPTLVVLKANPKQYLLESEIPGAASITNSLSAIKELVLKKTCGETDHMKGLWLSKVRIKKLYPCKCKSKQKYTYQAQPKAEETTKQPDAASDTEVSAPDVKTEITEGPDANLTEDDVVKAEPEAIAGPSTASEDTTLATEDKGEYLPPPGQLTAGELSPDHLLIDDDFPEAEVTLKDWRNDSLASQAVKDLSTTKSSSLQKSEDSAWIAEKLMLSARMNTFGQRKWIL
jgi:hypothetical protein